MAGAGKRGWGWRCGGRGRRLADGAVRCGVASGGGCRHRGGVGFGAALPVVFLAKPSGRTAGLTLGGVVLTVNGDGAVVERQLAGGELGWQSPGSVDTSC